MMFIVANVREGFILFSLFWATWIHPMSLEVRTIGYLQVL
jgi:hypothetical protein